MVADSRTSRKRHYEIRERIELQDAFLAYYVQNPNFLLTCRRTGIPRTTVYQWITNDINGFTARYNEAREEATELIEAELHRRVIDGTKEPVFYQGKKCGEISRFSDILLIFYLKSLKPYIYRDNAPAGPPIQNIIVIGGEQKPLKQLSDDELDTAIHEMKALPEGKDNV